MYDASGGCAQAAIDLANLYQQCGITPKEGWDTLIGYAVPKGWAKYGGGGKNGWACLTVEGVEAVEEWRTAMRTATEDPARLDGWLRLYRREAFNADLPSMVKAASPSEPLALIMADIDYFKRVNDEHGHQMGDDVLLAVAGAIRACVGTKGLVYRYGGEELVVLLPNYTVEEATALGERIRKQVEGTAVGANRLMVTVSIGIACLPDHAEDGTTLVAKADTALREAKNLGRNYVRVAGEPMPSKLAPRSIARKEPEPGGLTQDEMEAIRADYFRRGLTVCPRDAAELRVRPKFPLSQEGKALIS